MTFDAIETIERNGDSIDKLTLLVSKMKVKMDKREPPYKPRVYQDRPRGQSRIDNKLSNLIIDPSVEIGIEIGTTTTTEIIIGPTIGIHPGTPTDVTIKK